MTDELNVSSAPANTGTSGTNEGSPAAETSQEKMLRQSEVNDIVHARTRDAATKADQIGYQRAQAEYKAQQEARQSPANNTVGGMVQLSPDEIQKRITEGVQQELQRNQRETEVAHLTNRLMNKMVEGTKKYPDFDSVASKINWNELPEVLIAADQLENTADVLYDLAKPGNRYKLAQLDMLAKKHPEAAKEELQLLAASIKANEAASKEGAPRAPIEQLSPSPLSTGSGPMTVGDFKNRYRGKG